jgi:putative hemolysin
MDTHLMVELLAILLLILANGFFALSEFSIIASRKSKLRQNRQEGKPGAARAEKLFSQPDKFLASIQVGITLFGTLAGVFGGVALVSKVEAILKAQPIGFLARTASPVAVGAVAVLITVAAVVFGELVPKYVALSQPEKFARHVSRPVYVFVRFSSFFATLLSGAANLVVRALGIHKRHGRSPITEDEINMMIFEGKEKGVFDDTEEKLIRSVFDFADSTARRAMTPRTEVVGIGLSDGPEKIFDLVIEHGFSRYPVFDQTLDRIVGVVYAKDIIVRRLDPRLIIVKDMCRKPTFVPDSMPLSKLLEEFQRKKYHMAIVLDEYGGTAGIITLEDILEELVGEIMDEYDSETAPMIKHSETVAFAEGSVWPGAVNELLGSRLPEDQAETMAGLFFDTLGHLPEKNESVEIADIVVTVLERDENRLTRLKLEKKPEPSN